MYSFIAITTVCLLLSLGHQHIVSARNSSIAVKQCASDQQCVDIDYCLELELTGEDQGVYRYERIVEWHKAFCGNGRKVCCQIPPENKINTPECGLPIENMILLPTYDLFENPWMALIHDSGDRIICSGTIIAGSYVLTTASCTHASTGPKTVRVGEFDLSRSVDCSTDDKVCAEAPVDVAVLRMILHPQYDRITRENDIALLKTSTMQFSKSIRPICLSIDTSREVSLVGWNLQDVVPRKTVVFVVEAARCAQTIEGYANGTRKMDNKLCVGMEVSRNCDDDSTRDTLPGSSLQAGIGGGGRLVQQGILLASSQSNCQLPDKTMYAVLTNVTSHMDWIQANLH